MPSRSLRGRLAAGAAALLVAAPRPDAGCVLAATVAPRVSFEAPLGGPLPASGQSAALQEVPQADVLSSAVPLTTEAAVLLPAIERGVAVDVAGAGPAEVPVALEFKSPRAIAAEPEARGAASPRAQDAAAPLTAAGQDAAAREEADEALPAFRGEAEPVRRMQAHVRALRTAFAPASGEDEPLVFDLHLPEFRAGYLAASAWEKGDALSLPTEQKARELYLRGLAYRVAELRKDGRAGREFLAQARAPGGPAPEALLEAGRGEATGAPSLRRNLADADYVQGYITAAAWRPGKQLWMPAATFWQRLNPWLRPRMKARDERFMEGLRAGLREALGEPVLRALESELAAGPAVGTRDFAVKLGYVLETVLGPGYDKGLDVGLPFAPGKVRVPPSLLGLILGQNILISFGISLHVNSQAFLVLGLTGSKAMTGVVRNVHFASYAATNFLPIGPAAAKTDYATIFTWTSIARALLMGLIPALFFSGHLTFALLIAIVAFNPIFQSMNTNSDASARTSILGRDENLVREGTAFATKIAAVAGLIIPFLASYVVSLLVVAFGEPGGYAAAYAGYAGMLLLAVPVFRYLFRDPRYHDPSVALKPVRRPLNVFLPLWAALAALIKIPTRLFLGSGAQDGETLRAARSREVDVSGRGRLARLAEALARRLDRNEMTQGFAVMLRSGTLSLLTAVGAIEAFLRDALMFIVLPNYIIDVLHPQPVLGWIPVIGSMLATRVGIQGLMFTAMAIGSYLGSRWSSGPKGAERIRRLGHPFFYKAAALGSLLFWAMMIPILIMPPAGSAVTLPLFFTGLGVFLAMQFMTSLLHTPLGIVMAPVRREQLPEDRIPMVTQALSTIEFGLMALGGLAVGFLIDWVPIREAVFFIALAVTGTAVLQWLAPRWFERIKPKGWQPGSSRG